MVGAPESAAAPVAAVGQTAHGDLPRDGARLRTVSPSTIDRVLRARKRRMRRRLYGRTKPGTLLKHHIPVKTAHWDVTDPGFTEVDLVSHSGDSADGEFLQSLNLRYLLRVGGNACRDGQGAGSCECRH